MQFLIVTIYSGIGKVPIPSVHFFIFSFEATGAGPNWGRNFVAKKKLSWAQATILDSGCIYIYTLRQSVCHVEGKVKQSVILVMFAGSHANKSLSKEFDKTTQLK